MRTRHGASNRQRVASPGQHRIQSYPVTSTTSPTERVGRYQLLEPIGIGPSGAVSRAKVFGVAGFERQFAVKRFHGELTATAAMAAMLSAAARAYGSLEHPRIARMSEFGVAQGATFTAVEYVLGLDALRLVGEVRLAGVTLAAGGALALVSQAARAVGYAHGRGLTHLGLAPTNVIVTAEGDIKITDFGILSATLPQRPIEVPRLAQRIPYLAPEQLANEATSAATDVFALGVLAYELVTGNRTFKGETPQQVASAIMGGPPAEPLLPRPIVRVLQRCLARSPFERFPDARALADALDAALRVAPVPGTRKDIGVQVKETLDRLAALNEGQMSGMVALHLGTGPVRRPDEDDRRPGFGQEPPPEPQAPAYELMRPEPSDGPGLAAAGTTLQDMPRTPMTVPGLAPPPIPVPSGLGPIPSPVPPSPSGAHTLLGVGKPPPAIPAIKPIPRPGSISTPATPPAIPPAALRPLRPATDLSIPIEVIPPDAPLDAPSEPAFEARVDSQIHALDPSDLMSVEPPSNDRVTLDLAAPDAPEPSLPPAIEAPAPPRAEPAPVVAAHGDTPSSRIAQRATPPGGTASSWLDPHSVDTKPVPLFDPIARSEAETPPAGHAAHDDHRDADAEAAAEAAAEPAPPPSDAASPSPALAEPKVGQTILGYAAPIPLPRQPTPGPMPQVPPPASEAPAERPSDELSSMALEGFRPVAPAPAPPVVPWQREAFDARAEEPPPAPPLAPPTAPTQFAMPPPQMPAIPPPQMPPPQMPHLALVPPPAPSPQELPATAPPPGWLAPPPPSMPTTGASSAARPRRRMLWIAVGMVGAAVVAIGGWQIYEMATAPSGAPPTGGIRVTKSPSDAALAVAPDAAASVVAAAPDAGEVVAAAPADAQVVATAPDAPPAPGDASQTVAVAPTPGPGSGSGTADMLSISSTPPGARVFLDGSDAGTTPIKRPGSPDRHNIAVLLAGHDLYLSQVDGRGTFQIALKEITPSNGPAGIKVLRCKDLERYYVFVDGKPTGQTCPTERIGCEVGPHTVEVYDIVSETRRKWEFVVKDTRLSFRIRVE